jgi:acetoacetyl-CoA synthetase
MSTPPAQQRPTAPHADLEPIWAPDPFEAPAASISGFGRRVAEEYGVAVDDYPSLWAWSVEHPEDFWSAVWRFFDVAAAAGPRQILSQEPMPAARWFTGARLNYAENALRNGADHGAAIIAITEDGTVSTITWGQLRAEVASFAGWLRQLGVQSGDRVVGYLPNGVHAVVAFLASASIGAIWSACGQDYGSDGAAAKLGQLEPAVLVAADGYRWNGTAHDRREQVLSLVKALPALRATVWVPHLGLDLPSAGAMTTWAQATARPAELRFEALPFDAPLWVLFSSGTTGVPKGIVHGHGGIVLEHLKLLGLHMDLRPGDPFLWYTTTNWMMWNLVVSGLLVSATIVLYDGSPTHPGPQRLFEIAAAHHVRALGVSPGYLRACSKAGLEPGRDLDLSALRTLGSTGSPLPAESYYWVRDHVGPSVQLASGSGGTDVATGFAGSAPTTPVWPGEISAPNLGVALDAWDDNGKPVLGQVGELVITAPMPSMPLYFWNDSGGTRYHDAYFAAFPGVWKHGDWVAKTPRGSLVFSGRSDSTLNRQGVRLGSADIYDVAETLPGIREALVIGAELADGGYWMPLFVVLDPGTTLDDAQRLRIKTAIAHQASPRHIPDEIIEVAAIPHTRTGKKLEVPVKRLIQGAELEHVASPDAVDDFAALAYFTRYARRGPVIGSPGMTT